MPVKKYPSGLEMEKRLLLKGLATKNTFKLFHPYPLHPTDYINDVIEWELSGWDAKVGILYNPLDGGGSPVNVAYGDNTDFDPLYSAQNPGVLLMLDHRTPVARQAAQTETVFVILEF